MHTFTRLVAIGAMALGATACGGAGSVHAPAGETVTIDPNAGPPGCAEFAAHMPTPREREDGCLGDNGDLYLDAVASVPDCERWTERPVTQRDVEEGCRAGPVELAMTAQFDCFGGPTLFWNQVVWGYVGQPAHAHPPGADTKPPVDEREACAS